MLALGVARNSPVESISDLLYPLYGIDVTNDQEHDVIINGQGGRYVEWTTVNRSHYGGSMFFGYLNLFK